MLDDYEFILPVENISQRPTHRREAARLMVVDRTSGFVVESSVDHRVGSLSKWLRSGDLLVINTTRVVPARLVGRKASGGAAEALLLGAECAGDRSIAGSHNAYRALIKCRGKLRPGLEFEFIDSSASLSAVVEALHDRGEVSLVFAPGVDPYSIGRAPLPPYIKRASVSPSESVFDGREDVDDPDSQRLEDLERYQTVYAKTPGAIAAPTAGLHLTEAIFRELRQKGIEVAEVVLHVGAGTFRPLDESAFSRGRLHAEHFELPEETAEAIELARARGGRIIAVGTTTTRVLESRVKEDGRILPGSGETDLFILPGSSPFRVVDGMLTNFHLPRSSLLLLVAAFLGREPLLAAYQEAIESGFRFYSYGDAMLILPDVEALAHG